MLRQERSCQGMVGHTNFCCEFDQVLSVLHCFSQHLNQGKDPYHSIIHFCSTRAQKLVYSSNPLFSRTSPRQPRHDNVAADCSPLFDRTAAMLSSLSVHFQHESIHPIQASVFTNIILGHSFTLFYLLPKLNPENQTSPKAMPHTIF